MRDLDLWHRAQNSIAQGVLTNSKSPHSHVFGISPKYITAAIDVTVTSGDGKRYTDYICGLGANILGYGNQFVTNAVMGALPMMGSHSLPTDKEILLAEKLKEVIPFAERVKFLKTGTEACMAAIKIARAVTGRLVVLSDGYHGWSDTFVSLTPPAFGVKKSQGVYHLADIEAINENTAAVIVEPVITDFSNERREYLQALRDKCAQTGTLLIFDEVITGFRFPKYTVSRYFNIIPDILIIGKAMANGFPLAAVIGSKTIMDDPRYFVSSTYAGECLSLVAAHSVITTLQTNPFYSLDELWTRGQYFINAFNSMCPSMVRLDAYPTRGIFMGEEMPLGLFMQEAARAGLLFCRSWFYNAHHPKHDDMTLSTCEHILGKIYRGEVRLQGQLPVSPLALALRLKK